MTTSSLQGNLLTSSLQTLPNEGTNNIGKTEKGQTIQTSPVPTFSTEKFSNTTTSMTDKRHGHHKQQINSTTSMSTLMSQDLCEINKASNITEHTIFTSNFQKSISTQFAKEVESLRNIVNSLDEKLKNETDSSQKIAIYDALKEINGFITRYQNTGLGGFDKVKASEIRTSELLFKNLPKDLHSQTQEYETIKKDFEDTEKKFQRLQKR